MKFLIVGGTGTLGKELIRRFYDDHEIDVLSRDEFKQAALRKVYPKAGFILGDIRDWVQMSPICYSQYDAVFHCAALKHVDIGESNVSQFVQTNYNGTVNLAKKCKGKSKLVFFSTDKAVLPINVYGMSKALGERYIQSTDPEAVIFRWGNILGSRGSILDFFAQRIQAGSTVPITDMRMTRFWLTINEAIDYVMKNWQKGISRNPLIPPVKSASVVDVAKAIGAILGKPVKMKEIGIRPGEKLHETLKHDANFSLSSDTCEKFEMDELIVKIRQVMKE